jgi:hypothetical protein
MRDPVTTNAIYGSSIVAVLSRLGDGAPSIDDNGNLVAGGELNRKVIANMGGIDVIRAAVAAYQSVTADNGRDDQDFALGLIEEMLDRQKAGIVDAPEDRLLFLMGGGGCGKTEVIAKAVKSALDKQLGTVVVVAPTNRAAKVLSKRIKRFTGDSPFLRIGTCHSVFRKLSMNAVGEALVRHFVNGDNGAVISPYCDPATLAEVNDMYSEFLERPKALKKANAIAAQLADMPDRSVGEAAILRHMGFGELDYRVTYWSNSVCEAAVVFCDEVSMVASAIVKEALGNGAVVVCSGDAAQLPPVSLAFTNAAGQVCFDVPAIDLANARNSVFLWQSRRTDNDSPIRILADAALKARSFTEFVATVTRMAADPSVPQIVSVPGILKVPRADLEAGPVLAYTNATRHRWNELLRRSIFQRPDDRIVPGDKFFVSRLNPHDHGAHSVAKDEFLALTGVNSTPGEHAWTEYMFQDEMGREFSTVDVALFDDKAKGDELNYLRAITGSPGVYHVEQSFYTNPTALLVSFANVLTIHKSQGSEWDTVTLDLRGIGSMRRLFEEDDDTPGLGGVTWKRWRRLVYTAVSRARSKLNVII